MQVAQQPGTQLSYIVDHQPIDPSQPVAIDLSQPGFVRVEFRSVTGNGSIAFSNRIYLQHPRCDVNQDGAIDITDVQSVVGVLNQTVPPAPALRPAPRWPHRRAGCDAGCPVLAGTIRWQGDKVTVTNEKRRDRQRPVDARAGCLGWCWDC